MANTILYIINNMATLVLLIMIDGYHIDLPLIDNTMVLILIIWLY